MKLKTKLLLILLLSLLTLFLTTEYIRYRAIKNEVLSGLHREARDIRGVLMATRRVYHLQFLNSGIPLTDKTLGFLPAHSLSRISSDFRNWTTSELYFNNVSDRPRNPGNAAGSIETEAINYFRRNPNEKERFVPYESEEGKSFYHFSAPIWVEEYCLKCHGKREDAPPAIRSRYASSYNYEIGDLRGVMSIKLSAAHLSVLIWTNFKKDLWIHLASFFGIFFIISWMLNRYINKPLNILTGGLELVAGGNLDHSIDGLSGEMAIVGKAFNDMSIQLNQRENEENKKSSFLQLHQIAAVSSNEAHEIEDALVPILKAICSYTAMSIGHAYVISKEDPSILEPTAIWNSENLEDFHIFCEITKTTKFKKGKGLPGRVMADCRPHWIKDVTKDHDFHRKQTAEELGIKTGFAFPVMVETEVVAVLEFFSTEAIEPDNQLLEVMSDVGTQMGRVFERKRMQEEHIKTQKLESVGILAGGIAHDFNNYLQGILSNIAIAKSYTDSNDKIYINLTESEEAVIQAKNLTQQLLTFSKGGEPIKKIISAPELVAESAKFALSGSRIRCELVLPDCECLIEADKGQMNQVFNNLFINADHAMPEGGIIRVSAVHCNVEKKDFLPLQEGRYVKITIKDHGTGISQEHLQKIFDPYFTTKEMGSGLGLATVFSIIKKHDGYITAESKLKTGTAFHIYLPASNREISREAVRGEAYTSRPKPAEEEHVQKETLLDGKRILLMDDELIIAKSVSQQLRKLKYKVEIVKDGTEAIEMYKEAMESDKPFDAVIMDLTIPGGMGGKETIKELLEIDPDVKAIVASGYSNDPLMTNFSEYGFKGVVEKPFEIYELEEVLQKVIM